jgi:hypothetical protein
MCARSIVRSSRIRRLLAVRSAAQWGLYQLARVDPKGVSKTSQHADAGRYRGPLD